MRKRERERILEILETSSEAQGIIIDAETRWLHSLIRLANIEDEDGLNNLRRGGEKIELNLRKSEINK